MSYKKSNTSMINTVDKVSLLTEQLVRDPVVAVSPTNTLKAQLN